MLLEQLLCAGKASRMHIQRSGERTRSLQSPGSSSRVDWQSCLLDDLLQQWFLKERNLWHSSSILPLGNYWSANTGNSTKPGKSQKKSCKPNNSRTLHRMEDIWVHNRQSSEWSYYSVSFQVTDSLLSCFSLCLMSSHLFILTQFTVWICLHGLETQIIYLVHSAWAQTDWKEK